MRQPIFINRFYAYNPYSSRVRRFARRLPCCVLLIAACLCLGWADTWDGIRSAAADVDAISADFVQEKHLPILAGPLVSRGRLYYRRPDALRWEYTSPVQSVLLMRDGDARRFVRFDRGLVEDDGVRLQAMQLVMPEISGWLAGRFQDNPLFEAGLQGGKKIVLVPKDAGMGRFVQRIELWMSQQPGVLEAVLIFESEDAFTRVVFSNTMVNPALDDRIFREVQ